MEALVVYLRDMSEIILLIHDIRSTHNVGSLLRTAECLGVCRVYITGYTPYPKHVGDMRLPHIAEKLHKAIHKTALGAESLVSWQYEQDVTSVILRLRDEGYRMVGLEQSPASVSLDQYATPPKIALLIGREVEGIDPELLSQCDDIVEIPQFGQKESLNVVQATAIALYRLRTP